MSKHSVKFVLKEDKFNLKTIIYFFILIDLFLLPFDLLEVLWWLAIYQTTIVVSLMVGLKGQGRYKRAMGELQSIARDRSLSVDDREHMLVQGVHHYCLELGTIALERNRSYGLNYFTKKSNSKFEEVKKKTKKKEVKKKMSKLIIDDIVWKQIGYTLVSIWLLFDPVIAYWLLSLELHWVIIVFLIGTWGIIGAFVLFYIHYAFNLEQKPIEPEPFVPDSGPNTT